MLATWRSGPAEARIVTMLTIPQTLDILNKQTVHCSFARNTATYRSSSKRAQETTMEDPKNLSLIHI